VTPSLDVVTKAVLSWILDKINNGKRVAMASVIEISGSVPGKPGARLAVSSDGGRRGTIGGAGLELKVENTLLEMLKDKNNYSRKGGNVEKFLLYKDGKNEKVTALDSLCGGTVTIAMEVLEPMPNLLLVGGGHVGRSISKVCENLGWSHSVFDVRPEYCNEVLYPNAEDLFSTTVEDFLDSEDSSSIERFSDILLLSHDWNIDEEMMIGILKIRNERVRPRIGAIGSNKKWSSFRKSAVSSGISEDFIDSVRCPIGLDIGAESPEEIALAVCSEILSLDRIC